MAAASKSARILLLAPVLVSIALARRGSVVTPDEADEEDDRRPSSASRSSPPSPPEPASLVVRELRPPTPPDPLGSLRAARTASLGKSIVDALPGFILGYVALAIARAVGDRALAGGPGIETWISVLAADRFVVDVLMSAVAAGIGLHLSIRAVLGSSLRAAAVGAGASLWMAGLTVGMIACIARGKTSLAIAAGAVALVVSFALYRALTSAHARGRSVSPSNVSP